MRIRLTQIDGKLPNLALMKLAHYHRGRGDEVCFTKHVERDMFEPDYDIVYGSAIFSFSANRVALFREQFPGAIVGGTHNTLDNTTVEQVLGIDEGETYDYSIYPKFDGSIGFTQRGCRLKCGFCVVPKKEGKPRSVNTIDTIWRGEPWPRHLHLLDNDFFGQPREQWQARVDEVKAGGFRVCLNQGINTRMIDDESAAAIKAMGYWDDSFKVRRLYTAWDNIGDEARFFRGVETLAKHGIPPSHLLVYMLVGYDKRETWERLFYRFKRMADLYIRVYPMVYCNRIPEKGPLQEAVVMNRYRVVGDPAARSFERKTLSQFQRYVIKRYYTVCPFEDFENYALQEQNTLTKTGQHELNLT